MGLPGRKSDMGKESPPIGLRIGKFRIGHGRNTQGQEQSKEVKR